MHEIENTGIGTMRQHSETQFISLALGKNCLKSNVKHVIFCVEKYLSSANQFDFEILSLNTRSIGGQMNSPKRRKIFNYLKKHSYPKSIIFLQETHSMEKADSVWTNQWGCGRGSILFSQGTSDSKGVLIAF